MNLSGWRRQQRRPPPVAMALGMGTGAIGHPWRPTWPLCHPVRGNYRGNYRGNCAASMATDSITLMDPPETLPGVLTDLTSPAETSVNLIT